MRFDLNDDQWALRGAVADYLSNECPVSVTLAAHEEPAKDRELWRGLMGLGLGGVNSPTEFGGMGLGMLDLAVIAEVIGRHAAPGHFFSHALATQAFTLTTSRSMQELWLPKLVTGEVLATVALGESSGRWLADDWTLQPAETLSGSKSFVPIADEADVFVVGLRGGALGIVDATAPGISRSALASFDAGRPLFKLEFDGVPCTLLTDADGRRLCDAGLILLCADAFGGASHCVDSSVAYAKEREQFGLKIGAFQAVKHQLADMAVEVEPSAALFWQAARAFDQDPTEGTRFAALAKAHLTDIYATMARRMIELHGGIGYTWEFGAHVWLKRSVFDRAFLGSPSRHRARYAELVGW